jgi:hypothetical protein
MASAIIAIEREGDPHSLTVVAADLKAIGAPAVAARIELASRFSNSSSSPGDRS